MNSPTPYYLEDDPKALDLRRIGKSAPKPKIAGEGAAMPTGPPDDEYSFWRFADLRARNIVSDRADLFRKQQRGFPRAVKLSKGQGAVALFPQRAVKQWLRDNMNLAEETAEIAG